MLRMHKQSVIAHQAEKYECQFGAMIIHLKHKRIYVYEGNSDPQ